MDINILLLIIFIVIAIVVLILFFVVPKKTIAEKTTDEKKQQQEVDHSQTEIDHHHLEVLAEYVKNQKDQMEAAQTLKELKKAELKQKLAIFKQTKDLLADKLKAQLDIKEWKPLESVLKNIDKGGIGIYVLYNENKNKYYVGQAKQLYKRIRSHFIIEDIAKDFLFGDKIHFKILTANELDADYRMDHIEKTGIEIFSADKNGYNKNSGNV